MNRGSVYSDGFPLSKTCIWLCAFSSSLLSTLLHTPLSLCTMDYSSLFLWVQTNCKPTAASHYFHWDSFRDHSHLSWKLEYDYREKLITALYLLHTHAHTKTSTHAGAPTHIASYRAGSVTPHGLLWLVFYDDQKNTATNPSGHYAVE